MTQEGFFVRDRKFSGKKAKMAAGCTPLIQSAILLCVEQ